MVAKTNDIDDLQPLMPRMREAREHQTCQAGIKRLLPLVQMEVWLPTITDPFLNTRHGAWGKKEKNTFAVTILLFQFNPEGSFLGTLKARATLSLNNRLDTFDSDDYQFEFFDPDGKPIGFVGIGAAHGTRIKVEPLS